MEELYWPYQVMSRFEGDTGGESDYIDWDGAVGSAGRGV